MMGLMSSQPAAAIVAGGQARRFGGRDKSRLTIDGRTIIVRQVEVLQMVTAEVFIVAPKDERFRDLGLPVHLDRVPNAGVLGGIYTALEVAAADRVLVIACDLPFLDGGLLRLLVERAGGGDGAWVRTDRGVEPLLACYQRAAAARLRERIDAGMFKASDLGDVLKMIDVTTEDVARFGSPDRLLTNLNTPDDYARVQYPAS